MSTLSRPPTRRYRILCLLALALSLACVTISTAAAAAPAPKDKPSGPLWGIRPALYGKTQLPHNHFTYGLRAGTRLADGIGLINFQDTPQTLHVYAADMIPVRGGGFAPAQAYQRMRQIGAWVHLAHARVTVPAHGQVRDPFQVAIPHGTPPGEYLGAVAAAARGSGAGSGIRIETRAALMVRLTVPGTINLRVGLTPLSAKRQGGDEHFSLLLRNHGNVTFTFSGVLLVRDGGHAPHRISLGPANTYVVPGGYTVLHSIWHGVPLIGRITASAVIHILINDKPYRTYTSQTLTLTFFPWTQAAASLLGLLLLLVLAFATRRRWSRRLRERREERAALAAFRAQRRAEKGAHQP